MFKEEYITPEEIYNLYIIKNNICLNFICLIKKI